MTHPDVTLGEILRRLEKVEHAHLSQSLAASFRVTDQAYIAAVENRVRDLEEAYEADRKQRASDRRMVFAAIVAPLLVGTIMFILSTVRFS